MQDPRNKYPKPPYKGPKMNPPGIESEMEPSPDYGKDTYKGNNRLEGMTAVISGADSGIGRAVAYAYACEGADVVIPYLSEDGDATETVKAVESTGRRAIAIPGDLKDQAHCKKVIAKAVGEFGKVDILVNNAAFQMTYKSILDIPAEDIEKTFQTNIISYFYMCQAALPHMKPGGSIINTASIQAYQPSANLLAYASTKGAVVNFTKGLAQEVIERGIRVNAVAPGPVWTPLIPSTMPEEKYKGFGKDSLLGRTAQPAELAPVYVFLASEDASFVVGQIYGVTGKAEMP